MYKLFSYEENYSENLEKQKIFKMALRRLKKLSFKNGEIQRDYFDLALKFGMRKELIVSE